MRKSLKGFFPMFIGMVLLLFLWIAISSLIENGNMIFPGPKDTIAEVGMLLRRKYTYECISSSVFKTFTGFVISFLIAVILGSISGNISFVKGVMSPFFSILKSIPTASLVFLFLVLFGSKNAPVVMVAIISLPIIYESVVRGFENLDESIKNAARVDGAGIIRRICKIYLPNVLPYILVGVASSFSLSFKIEIMAEVISGSTSRGLGSIISACQKSDPTNMVPIFAYSFITIVLVGILSLILFIIEKKTSDKINN